MAASRYEKLKNYLEALRSEHSSQDIRMKATEDLRKIEIVEQSLAGNEVDETVNLVIIPIRIRDNFNIYIKETKDAPMVKGKKQELLKEIDKLNRDVNKHLHFKEIKEIRKLATEDRALHPKEERHAGVKSSLFHASANKPVVRPAEPPDEFMCPIELVLMIGKKYEPIVIGPSGRSISREGLDKIEKLNNEDPFSGKPITAKIINVNLKNVIEAWLEEHPEYTQREETALKK